MESACSIPATGPRAPARTLVAVRAMVPVAGSPPNRLEAMLATPCATSSQFDRCRRPVMPSATTAESRALDRAEQREGHGVGQHGQRLLEAERRQGRHGQRARDAAEAAGDGLDRKARAASVDDGRDHGATSMPGQVGRSRLSPTMMPSVSSATPMAAGLAVGSAAQSAISLGTIGPGSAPASAQAEELLELAGEDDDRDPGREAHRDRVGDELDVGAEPQEADHEQEDARHPGREQHPVDAVPLDGGGHEHDEGPGRAADLEPAAAQRRDQEAADDRRVEPAVRRGPGGDRDRHRQRQGDDRDREPGDEVGAEILEPVTLAQHGDELGREQLGEAGLAGACALPRPDGVHGAPRQKTGKAPRPSHRDRLTGWRPSRKPVF